MRELIMTAPGPTLIHHHAGDLGLSQARSLMTLVSRAFPEASVPLEQRLQHFRALRERHAMEMFVVWDGERAIANATIFAREVKTQPGPLRLMALAAVCSDPDHRGEGWGRMVVQAAFGEVDSGRFPVTLFQTGVPDFYAGLGARKIDNRFVNTGEPDPHPGRGTREQPWWNPHIMIYPAPFRWPAGTVDLCGPGY